MSPVGLSLPVAPLARRALRHFPLAADTRAQDRAWRPIYAVWELTLKCDLACRHCGSRAARARPDELSTVQCLDLVRQMADLGVMEVTVIGGEAYLRDDWIEIVRAIRQAGMWCSMTTGGRGIPEERAQAAAEAGLRSASVSLDGGEATHDRLRGVAGAYRAVLQAATNLRKAGIKVAVNMQIPDGALDRRQHPRRLAEGHLGTIGRAPVRAGSNGGRSLGLLPDLLLRGCLPRRMHLDRVLAVRQARQQSLCHHRALEMRRLGKRERLVQIDRAPGEPFDNGRFEIIVEDIKP